MLMTLRELAHKIGADYEGDDRPFLGAVIDSRTVQPGALFVAIKGLRVDGHDFVDQAIHSGAGAVMVEKKQAVGVPQIIVKDVKEALGKMAAVWRQQFHIPILALTGSCGKTSTKEMMASILREAGVVLATEGNLNNFYGVPLMLLKIRPEHQFVILEMGTNSPGEIQYLTQMARPTLALITNIQASHLEGLKSLEGVSEEKSDIFTGLLAAGVAVINQDEPFAKSWESKISVERRVVFALESPADVFAKNVQYATDGVCFDVCTPIGEVSVHLKMPGRHIVTNALAATAATLAAGATLNQVSSGLMHFQPVNGRCKPFELGQEILLIDDTYNASFPAVKSAIQTLAHYQGKKIFVMSNMGELGAFSAEYHRQMGELLTSSKIDVVLLFGEAGLLHETQKACPKAQYFETKAALIEALKSEMVPGATILVKGSHGNQMGQVVEALLGKDNAI